MTKKLKKEASTAGAGSTVADIKGFSAPFGSVPKSKKGRKKKSNPSKPYNESALFENAVAQAVLDDNLEELFKEFVMSKLGEVVKKRGNMWTYHDDETGAEKGSWPERETAWEKQRQDRRAQSGRKKLKRAEKERGKVAGIPTVEKDPESKKKKPKVAPKPKVAKKAQSEKPKRKPKVRKVESLMRDLLMPINEGSMISYVFENTPVSDESVTWEKFIDRLSKQTVLSDPGLKKILQNMAKSEGKLLEKTVGLIGTALGKTGNFGVEKKKVEIDPETKDVKINFEVTMEESNTKVTLAVKLENGRPLILFPDETRNILNSLATDESKLLRAELMHVQETMLDNMQDVITITQKRDTYLKKMEVKVDKLLNSLSNLEISMIRYLLRNKYKEIK